MEEETHKREQEQRRGERRELESNVRFYDITRDEKVK